jgi:hypothetical protein
LSSHVPVAIAGTAVVVSVSIAAVVLRDSATSVVTVVVVMVMMSRVCDCARGCHRGDGGREQDESCDQEAAHPVSEHFGIPLSR